MTIIINTPEQLAALCNKLAANQGKITSAIDALELDLNRQRYEWYGDKWQEVDWYGVPLPPR